MCEVNDTNEVIEAKLKIAKGELYLAQKNVEKLENLLKEHQTKNVTNFCGNYIKYSILGVQNVYMFVDKQKNGKYVQLSGYSFTILSYLNPKLCAAYFKEYETLRIEANEVDNCVKIITKEEFERVFNNEIKSLQRKIEELIK
jgi:hypothetical protein